MSIRPSIARGARRFLQNERCVLCLYHSPQYVRCYATKYRLDPSRTPQEIRTDIDKRNRHAYYRMLQADKLLPCKLEDADKIVHQFTINSKNNMDPATNARKLAEQYKINLVHLSMLAIPLFRIPDVNDTKAQLPPTQQYTVAAAMLLACSAAGDLQSTLQILNAVYYSTNGYNIPQAVEIARLFSPKDISNCRKMVEQLANGKDGKAGPTGDANAMTMHGKFLELAGEKQEARYFYEKALEKYDTKIHRGYPHPMALPWLKPWMEFVNLEQTLQAPSLIKITEALKFGALKADDPMAYYQLASLQESKSPEWLAYMSKTAASGHSEAMYKLGQFYLHVSEQPSNSLVKFRKALNFMMSWKRNATLDFAIEWFKAAAMGGYKPALIELAELYEKENAIEDVKNCLRAVLNEPPKGKQEEWPHLVLQARQRLAAM